MEGGIASSRRRRTRGIRNGTHQAGRPYAIVLLDAQMPGMDGFEVARRIRSSPFSQDTAMLMLSSVDSAQYLRECKQAGVSSYLTKPIKQSELLDAMVNVLAPRARTTAYRPQRAASQEGSELQHAPRFNHPLRVLLAEDNFVNQQLMLRVLAKEGHRVFVAAGTAWKPASSSESKWTWCSWICICPIETDTKRPPRFALPIDATVRVIACRLSPSPPMRWRGIAEKCLAAGMDDYVSKPIVFRNFLKP